jgi:hypothetical protein
MYGVYIYYYTTLYIPFYTYHPIYTTLYIYLYSFFTVPVFLRLMVAYDIYVHMRIHKPHINPIYCPGPIHNPVHITTHSSLCRWRCRKDGGKGLQTCPQLCWCCHPHQAWLCYSARCLCWCWWPVGAQSIRNTMLLTAQTNNCWPKNTPPEASWSVSSFWFNWFFKVLRSIWWEGLKFSACCNCCIYRAKFRTYTIASNRGRSQHENRFTPNWYKSVKLTVICYMLIMLHSQV